MLHSSRWRGIATILMPVLWVAFMVTGPVATAQTTRSNKDASFEDQFWKYIVGNNYKNWSPGFSESAEFYKGKNPHGAYVKMYVNRTAAGNIDDLAVGSVVILENYLKDQSLKTISVMYRTTGFNPDGNDWYWIEYRPDGSVVPSAAKASASVIRNVSLTASPKRMVMGKAANCIVCHRSAAGDDFVFSNDRFETPLQTVAEKESPRVAVAKVTENPFGEPTGATLGEGPGGVSAEDTDDAFDLIADADRFFGSN